LFFSKQIIQCTIFSFLFLNEVSSYSTPVIHVQSFPDFVDSYSVKFRFCQPKIDWRCEFTKAGTNCNTRVLYDETIWSDPIRFGTSFSFEFERITVKMFSFYWYFYRNWRRQKTRFKVAKWAEFNTVISMEWLKKIYTKFFHNKKNDQNYALPFDFFKK